MSKIKKANESIDKVVLTLAGYGIPFNKSLEYLDLVDVLEYTKQLEEENKKLKDEISKNVIKVTKTNSGKVLIEPTPHADTRTIETDITEEMLMSDTLKHIEAVNNLLKHSALKLVEAGKVHDRTKIGEDFDAFFKIIKSGKTGEDFFRSRWYKKHIREERHHINSRVPKKVNLYDVLEMITDIVAAGLARTGKVYPVNLTDEVLQDAVKNTVALLISESETVDSK